MVRAGLVHAQFETIPPFLDGNGRTGRLLITFHLTHEGVLGEPLLISQLPPRNTGRSTTTGCNLYEIEVTGRGGLHSF